MAPLPLARSTATAVLSMVFQPILDLDSEVVIGYEALARGPVGSAWERPQELFEQARVEGRLREMDWACRVAALRDVRAWSSTRPAWRLFVNSEPEVLGTICPEDLLADWIGGTDELEIVVEVTERALVHGPRRLIEAIDELRGFGCAIAMDDVGSNAASVALLPLIEPDVVKLDAALLRSPHSGVGLGSLRAVATYIERSGAVLLAEGIETERDRDRARSLGAQWGQGYLFARPRPLGPQDAAVTYAAPAVRRAPAVASRRADAPRLVVSAEWVGEHLRSVCTMARSGASMNVLLVRLPDPALAPEGFLPAVAHLQEVCALTLVVLGDGAHVPGERRDVVTILLGPAVAQCVVATRDADGRYDVTLDEHPQDVAAAARRFLADAR